jgi:DNA-damage-inducible protein D
MDKQIEATQAGFEQIKQIKNGAEYWSARDLMPLLDYSTWRMFENSISRAMTAAKESGAVVQDHFVGADKMVLTGSSAEREVTDYHLTRYACYLIAQNSDPRKRAIALAQTYFAAQTRRAEVSEQHKKDLERLSARHKLRETEQRFSGVVMDRDVDQKGIAEIRGAGDQALFGGHNTTAMKRRLGVSAAKPLADHLPTVTLKAKDLAAEMTTVNTLEKDLHGKAPIKDEHIDNNQAVRRALGERGIQPESLPPAEDTAKLERRLTSEARNGSLKEKN